MDDGVCEDACRMASRRRDPPWNDTPGVEAFDSESEGASRLTPEPSGARGVGSPWRLEGSPDPSLLDRNSGTFCAPTPQSLSRDSGSSIALLLPAGPCECAACSLLVSMGASDRWSASSEFDSDHLGVECPCPWPWWAAAPPSDSASDCSSSLELGQHQRPPRTDSSESSPLRPAWRCLPLLLDLEQAPQSRKQHSAAQASAASVHHTSHVKGPPPAEPTEVVVDVVADGRSPLRGALSSNAAPRTAGAAPAAVVAVVVSTVVVVAVTEVTVAVAVVGSGTHWNVANGSSCPLSHVRFLVGR
mmetsp:Transcript_57739/g.162857  ORF Transcript_57739/g.162857 Transcript_57739/m.162857 type:complete len:302 (+) Transcript_57739:447-1352(+)